MSASKYTPELAKEICERLSEGEPLRQICRDDHMPAWRTVYDWEYRDESGELSAAIARAREMGFDAIAEETISIADDGRNDWMERLDDNNKPIGWKFNGEHVQRSKLRIETRLKLLAKWNPRKYGDKVDVTTDGDKINVPTHITLTALQKKD